MDKDQSERLSTNYLLGKRQEDEVKIYKSYLPYILDLADGRVLCPCRMMAGSLFEKEIVINIKINKEILK